MSKSFSKFFSRWVFFGSGFSLKVFLSSSPKNANSQKLYVFWLSSSRFQKIAREKKRQKKSKNREKKESEKTIAFFVTFLSDDEEDVPTFRHSDEEEEKR